MSLAIDVLACACEHTAEELVAGSMPSSYHVSLSARQNGDPVC